MGQGKGEEKRGVEEKKGRWDWEGWQAASPRDGFRKWAIVAVDFISQTSAVASAITDVWSLSPPPPTGSIKDQ